MGLIGFLFLARGLPFLTFVPIWDGLQYAECVRDAVAGRNPVALNCYGHPAIAYTTLLALPELAAGAGYPGLLMINLALGLVAFWSFGQLLRELFPKVPSIELSLVTAVFSASPVVIAAAVNPNLDYGLLVFWLLHLYVLIKGMNVLAVVFGLAMVFSKETGLVLYTVSVGLRVFIAPNMGSLTGTPIRWRERLQQAMLFSIPIFLFMLVYPQLIRNVGISPVPFFETGADRGRGAMSFLAMEFVNQFVWTLSIFPLLWLAALVYRIAKKERSEEKYQRSSKLVFVLAILIWTNAVFRLLVTFSNDRYVLALIPLVCIIAYAAMDGLIHQQRLRMAILFSWIVLFLISNVATVDPVSKLIYGTFPFGTHELLDKTSLTGECCGMGRDQLQYNLQFTAFHYLTDDVLAALEPIRNKNLVLLADPRADWFLVGRINSDSHRTSQITGSMEFRLSDITQPGSYGEQDNLYIIDYPNFLLPSDIWNRFELVEKQTFQRLGYSINLFHVRSAEDGL